MQEEISRVIPQIDFKKFVAWLFLSDLSSFKRAGNHESLTVNMANFCLHLLTRVDVFNTIFRT